MNYIFLLVSVLAADPPEFQVYSTFNRTVSGLALREKSSGRPFRLEQLTRSEGTSWEYSAELNKMVGYRAFYVIHQLGIDPARVIAPRQEVLTES